MSSRKIVISGTGCALADYLYTGIGFDTPGFTKFLSKNPGDGGLTPGKLVFTEELESYAGLPYCDILKEISGKRSPDKFNIGGPGLVSLIHASQMLGQDDFDVKFFCNIGNDDTADKILELVGKTPLNISNIRKNGRRNTSFTDVLSDPTFDGGLGERTFINNIGAAWDFTPILLGDEFFNADITCFGGTALVPQIHNSLTDLLIRAKNKNSITVVNTVYDFRNEKKDPESSWPLVKDNDFDLIDILIMDREEASRISGLKEESEVTDFFISNKVHTFFITNGASDIIVYADGTLFKKMVQNKFQVSQMVTAELRSGGDTTGCGDNFAGGIITSLAFQLKTGKKFNLNPVDAISWGIASGGFACSYIGGTFFETKTGEKLKQIMEFRNNYLVQTGYL